MIDTLKIQIKNKESLNLKNLIKTETTLPDNPNQKLVKYFLPRGKNGQIAITHYENRDNFILECSAKTLDSNYLRGIWNLEELAEKCLEKSKDTLRFLTPEQLETATVYRCDHTLNLISEDKATDLFFFREFAFWGRKRIDRRFSDSAIFYNSQEILVVYDKLAELKKTDSNLLNNLTTQTVDRIIRFEYRPKKLEITRKNLDIKDDGETEKPEIILGHILRKAKQTIRRKFEEIKFLEGKPIRDYSKFIFDGGKIDNNFKLLGLWTYFESINFDESLLEKHLLNIEQKGTRAKYRKKLKELRNLAFEPIDNHDQIINRIKEKFSESLDKY